MKLTTELQSFLDEQCDKYCEQISLQKPLLITNIANLPNKGLKISVSLSMRYDKECLGLHYPSTSDDHPDLIFIDITRHKNRKQLIKTLVHELCHSKFETTIHNIDFYNNIKLILGGKRY